MALPASAAQAQPAQAIQVECPVDVGPGRTVQVQHDGAAISVVMPPGVTPGMVFPVQVPAASAAQTEGLQVIQVECPDGAAPGDTIQVQHGGAAMNVAVPPGVAPGAVFSVQMALPGFKPFAGRLKMSGPGVQSRRQLVA